MISTDARAALVEALAALLVADLEAEDREAHYEDTRECRSDLVVEG